MNAKILFSLATFLMVAQLTPCFAEEGTVTVTKPAILSGLGISPTLHEIDRVLAEPSTSQRITKIEISEFARRAKDIEDRLSADKAAGKLNFVELQDLSKEVYALSEGINNKLTPSVAAPIISLSQVKASYNDILQRIHKGRQQDKLHSDEARRFVREASHILQAAEQNKDDAEKVALANSDLTRLSIKVDRYLTATIINFRTANSYLNLPRAF